MPSRPRPALVQTLLEQPSSLNSLQCPPLERRARVFAGLGAYSIMATTATATVTTAAVTATTMTTINIAATSSPEAKGHSASLFPGVEV